MYGGYNKQTEPAQPVSLVYSTQCYMTTHARYQTYKTTVKYPKDQFVIAIHLYLRPHVLQEHFHLAKWVVFIRWDHYTCNHNCSILQES